MAKYIGYAGTYTKGGSEGIYCFELDTEAKRLSRPKLAAKLGNPTYVTPNSDNSMLYSIEKTDGKGGVAAYQIHQNSGELTFVNHQLIEGPSPCHVSIDDKHEYVLTANYHSGKVHAFPSMRTEVCGSRLPKPLIREQVLMKDKRNRIPISQAIHPSITTLQPSI